MCYFSKRNGKFFTEKSHFFHRKISFFILFFCIALSLYAQQDSLSRGGMHYELKGITVKGKMPQIIQSRDTAIINPGAYHTPKGAYLKDLVKRVPGLEYNEKNGTLTFNGKTIREIMVNGKTFFSGNIQVPIENLPLNLISRLKVYKRQSDEEKALGIRSGKEFYVLDLQTKKDFNKTFMNAAVAGMGTQRKKQFELHSDYFETGGENFSLHATSGNRYNTDLYKGSTNNSIGLNLTHQLKEGLMLTGNLQYNRSKSGNESSNYLEQYLQENNNYALSQNVGRQNLRSVNGYANLNWEIDKKTQLTLTANYGHTESSNTSEGQSATIKTPLKDIDLQQPFARFDKLPDSLRVNRNRSMSASSSHGNSYTVSASFIRRLNEKGTVLSLNLQNSFNGNYARETSENSTTYYQLHNAAKGDSIFVQNLLKQSPTSNNNWTAGFSFVQPLTKRLKLRLSYNFQSDRDKSTHRTFGTPSGLSNYEYVDSLSGYSSSHTYSHDIGLSLNYTSDIWNVDINTALMPGTRSLSHHLYGEAVDTLGYIMDFRTALHIERTKNNRTLTFDYNANSIQPDLMQLIPLTNNTDPLNISRGNPSLKPTYSHTWMVSYNALTKGFSLNMSFNLIQNSVTQATHYNTLTGGREYYPVNINGNWSGNLSGSWWKTFGLFNIAAMGTGSYNRSVNLLSETNAMQRNRTQSIFTMSSLQAGYSPSWGNISLRESYNYNYTINSLQRNGNYTHDLSSALNAFTDLPFGLQLQTDFMYTFRTGDNIPASEKHQTMWNASATYRFLKERRMEVTLTWQDILNHYRMYYRTSSSTGFYESYSPQIRSYILLTLKYRFQITK